jgi:hypothetical protein
MTARSLLAGMYDMAKFSAGSRKGSSLTAFLSLLRTDCRHRRNPKTVQPLGVFFARLLVEQKIVYNDPIMMARPPVRLPDDVEEYLIDRQRTRAVWVRMKRRGIPLNAAAPRKVRERVITVKEGRGLRLGRHRPRSS